MGGFDTSGVLLLLRLGRQLRVQHVRMFCVYADGSVGLPPIYQLA